MTDQSNTTNPPALRALAERCSKEGPSWQLDDAIAQEVFGVPPCGTAGPLRNFTHNTDHALTLRLDWMSVQINTGGDLGLVTYVEVSIDPNGIYWADAQADTPAAAVCAALLSGRADADDWAMHFLQPALTKPEGE